MLILTQKNKFITLTYMLHSMLTMGLEEINKLIEKRQVSINEKYPH